MDNKDIRWIQRFNNYKKVLAKLSVAVDMDYELMSEIEQAGLIHFFEMTYELAWKTLQDFLREKGHADIKGPSQTITKALEEGIIKEEEGWWQLKESRELTTHTYDEETANEIAQNTMEKYYDLLVQLETRLEVERLS